MRIFFTWILCIAWPRPGLLIIRHTIVPWIMDRCPLRLFAFARVRTFRIFLVPSFRPLSCNLFFWSLWFLPIFNRFFLFPFSLFYLLFLFCPFFSNFVCCFSFLCIIFYFSSLFNRFDLFGILSWFFESLFAFLFSYQF